MIFIFACYLVPFVFQQLFLIQLQLMHVPVMLKSVTFIKNNQEIILYPLSLSA